MDISIRDGFLALWRKRFGEAELPIAFYYTDAEDSAAESPASSKGSATRNRRSWSRFDVSARPFVPGDVLSFAVPMNKFAHMIENMAESFLVTPSWGEVRTRLN